MGAVSILPASVPETSSKSILTFVVPALNGCNLRCPFCFVGRRKEAEFPNEEVLSPDEYAQFIDEVVAHQPVAAACIQGFEPLLPEAFPYTKKIIEVANRHGLKTGLVTNGTFINETVDDLSHLKLDKIAVSLDAASQDVHDSLRGVRGAWVSSIDGIQQAMNRLSRDAEIVVTSVLMPKRRQWLEAIPDLLTELGMNGWIVTPLLKIGALDAGGVVGRASLIIEDLLQLNHQAKRKNIVMVVDDELGTLSTEVLERDIAQINALKIRTIAKKSRVIRFTPTGHCSVGPEILVQVDQTTPRWVPGHSNAGEFVSNLQRQQTSS